MKRIAQEKDKLKHTPKELADIDSSLCGYLLRQFQRVSVVAGCLGHRSAFSGHAVHRLNECPSRQAVISDITCDSDGRLDKFIDPQGMRNSLDLHPLIEGEEYYLGVFLVGA